MRNYEVILTAEAKKDLKTIIKSGNKASTNKLQRILVELENHPEVGIGKPENLKYKPLEWSRHIDRKNRIVYLIDNETLTVTVLQALGHYNDK